MCGYQHKVTKNMKKQEKITQLKKQKKSLETQRKEMKV